MELGTKEALEISEVTIGKIGHWARLGVLGLANPRPGKGTTRTYRVGDLVAVRALQLVLGSRTPLEKLGGVCATVRRWHSECEKETIHDEKNHEREGHKDDDDVVLLVGSDGSVREICNHDLVVALGNAPAACVLRRDKALENLSDFIGFTMEKIMSPEERRGRGRPPKAHTSSAGIRNVRRGREPTVAKTKERKL